MQNTLDVVRIEPGVRMEWRCRRQNGTLTRWYSITSGSVDPVPARSSDVIGVMLAHGHAVDEQTRVVSGAWIACPRCNGRGYYGGGRCFRCYGSRSTEFVAD